MLFDDVELNVKLSNPYDRPVRYKAWLPRRPTSLRRADTIDKHLYQHQSCTLWLECQRLVYSSSTFA